MLHYGHYSVGTIKRYLRDQGLKIRLTGAPTTVSDEQRMNSD